MRHPYDPGRLVQANTILRTFQPTANLVIAHRSSLSAHIALTLSDLPDTLTRPLAVVPNAAGSALASIGNPANRMRLGGTAEEGIACLIRYVRGRTCRPAAWWAARFPAATVEALRLTSYLDDPDRTNCVVCGGPAVGGQDWYFKWGANLNGPCCDFARCEGTRADGPAVAVVHGETWLNDWSNIL
jgi:hypothetical protein